MGEKEIKIPINETVDMIKQMCCDCDVQDKLEEWLDDNNKDIGELSEKESSLYVC